MEGYKLTAKGLFVLTLLFFAFFTALTSILWFGNMSSPPPPLIPQPVFSPQPENNAPSTIILSPPEENSTAPDSVFVSDDHVTPPPSGEPLPVSSQPPPPVSLNDNELFLLFPFAETGLSEQNKDALYSFFMSVQDAEKSDLNLIIEGYAYTNEALTEQAVSSLARERMQAVCDTCQTLEGDISIVSVYKTSPADAPADVVGASLYLVSQSGK